MTTPKYTVPGMKPDAASEVIGLLQDRLNALNDLALTLKHVHWNVVGPHFIAVHTMLDPQVDGVRVGEQVALLRRVGRVLLPAVVGVHRGESGIDAAGRELGVGVGLRPLAQGEHVDPRLGEHDPLVAVSPGGVGVR